MKRKMAENDDRSERLAFKSVLRLGMVLGVIGITLIVIGCVQFRAFSYCADGYGGDIFDRKKRSYEDNKRFGYNKGYSETKEPSYYYTDENQEDREYEATTMNYQTTWKGHGFLGDIGSGYTPPPTYRSRYRYDSYRYRNRWERTTDQPYYDQTTRWPRERYRNPWEVIQEYATSISPTYRSRYRYDRYRNRWEGATAGYTSVSPPTQSDEEWRLWWRQPHTDEEEREMYTLYREWLRTKSHQGYGTTPEQTTAPYLWWLSTAPQTTTEQTTTTSYPWWWSTTTPRPWWWWPSTTLQTAEQTTPYPWWWSTTTPRPWWWWPSTTLQTAEQTTPYPWWWSPTTEQTTEPYPWWWWSSTTTLPYPFETNWGVDHDDYNYSDRPRIVVCGFDFTYCTFDKIDLIVTLACGALFLGIATVGLLVRKNRVKCMFVFLLLLDLSTTFVALICTVAGGIRFMKHPSLSGTYGMTIAYEIMLLLSMVLLISHLVMVSRLLCCKKDRQHQYDKLNSHPEVSGPHNPNHDCKVEWNAGKTHPEMVVV